MFQADKIEAKTNCNESLYSYPSPILLEYPKENINCESPSNRICFEDNYSRLLSGKREDRQQLKINKRNVINWLRKGSYSYPFEDITSSYRINKAYYLPKRPIFLSSNINCRKVPTEQEKIAFLNQTRESSRKNSMNNNSIDDEGVLSPEKEANAFERQFSLEHSLCPDLKISEFNLYDNLQKIPRLNSTAIPYLNYPQEESLFVPNWKFIDNIEIERRKVSSMNSPFNKFNPYNISTQLSPQFINEENTEIMSISVKVNENDVLVFKVKRFDDLFNTIKLFCEINKINEELIKPLIMQVLRSLNQIYQAMNYCLGNEHIMRLEYIKGILLKHSKKNE